MSLYYNFSQYNSTAVKTILSQNDVLKYPLLDKASEYALAISKFSLPASEIETFRIMNDTDYTITYSTVANDNANVAYVNPSFTQSMYKSVDQPMKSIEDFIENFNRSSLLCHKGLLQAMNTYYGNVITKTAVSASVNAGTVASFDVNFDFSTGITPNNLFASYIAVTANIYGTTTKQNMEIQLIDPNGVMCILSSCKEYANSAITYEDGAINTQANTRTLTKSSYQPMESMVKFSESTLTQRGTWKIRVINKNSSTTPAFNVTYDISAKIYFAPATASSQMHFPRIPPTINLNGDRLELYYDDNLTRSGFQIGVSSRLNQILSFPSETADNALYVLNLPQSRTANSGALTLLKYPQPLPSAWKCLDICEIQLRSYNMPCDGEVSVFDKASVISSIDVDMADLNNSSYQYFNSNPSERQYQLTKTGQMNEFNLSIFVRYRSTNEILPVYLPPYTTFSALLKFIKL